MNVQPLIDIIQTDKRRGRGVVPLPVREARRALVSHLSEQAFPTVAAASAAANKLGVKWSKDPGEDAILAWAWTVDALHHAGRMGELIPALS